MNVNDQENESAVPIIEQISEGLLFRNLIEADGKARDILILDELLNNGAYHTANLAVLFEKSPMDKPRPMSSIAQYQMARALYAASGANRTQRYLERLRSQPAMLGAATATVLKPATEQSSIWHINMDGSKTCLLARLPEGQVKTPNLLDPELESYTILSMDQGCKNGESADIADVCLQETLRAYFGRGYEAAGEVFGFLCNHHRQCEVRLWLPVQAMRGYVTSYHWGGGQVVPTRFGNDGGLALAGLLNK